MAITSITQANYADVPRTSGVPSLKASLLTSAEAIASAEVATLIEKYLVSRAQRKWGIFDSSSKSDTAILTTSHVKAVELNVGYSLTTAPLENGAFAAYNKVCAPMRIALQVLCDGSSLSYGDVSSVTSLLSSLGVSGLKTAETVRSAFVETLDQLASNLKTYYVRTPEKSYPNMNVTGYAIRRSRQNGAYVIFADITMQEVRSPSTSTAGTTNTSQNGGDVQTSSLTTSQSILYNNGGNIA